MGSQTAVCMFSCSSSFGLLLSDSSSKTTLRPSSSSQIPPYAKPTKPHLLRFPRARTRAILDETEQSASTTPLLVQEGKPNREVEESVRVLKKAAKTRKVATEEVLSALSVIEKAKIEPSGFLDTLAVQRFDAEAKRIENGVYLGPIGCLTFEGKFSWKQRILAFIFECIRIKIGPFNPLEISLGQKEDREPNTKDPFFIWFYVDEEIAVARGRSGGTAFWMRCRRVAA